jgi:hypothetical protein
MLIRNLGADFHAFPNHVLDSYFVAICLNRSMPIACWFHAILLKRIELVLIQEKVSGDGAQPMFQPA